MFFIQSRMRKMLLYLKGDELFMKAKDIMITPVITLSQDASIEEIVKTLTENKISGVFVVDGEKPVGIVTDSDLLQKKSGSSLSSYPIRAMGDFCYSDYNEYKAKLQKRSAVKASEIMTTKLVVVTEATDVSEIASVMIEKNINRVPVVKDDKLVGVVTRGDIIKTLGQ